MKHDESIGRVLGCIHRQAGKYFHRKFGKLGLGRGAHLFLITLFHEDALSQNELSRRLHMDKAHTTRMIRQLIEQGLIQKENDPEDNRAYKIHITEKARQMKPEIIKILKSWTEIITDGFSDDEKQAALKLTKQMSENALRFVNHQNSDEE